MAINGLGNKVYRTRGQCPAPPPFSSDYGGETGSTCAESFSFCPALYHRYRAVFIVANDNYAPVAVAA